MLQRAKTPAVRTGEEAVEKLRPLRRAEYDALIDLGHFEDEKIELLYGQMVLMSPQGDDHMQTVTRLNMILAPALVGRATVQIHGPFIAASESEPEPDVAVLHADALTQKGKASQAHLIIEVAASSLRKDLAKGNLYAASGVPEYWIVDLEHNLVDVFTDPIDGRYTRQLPFDAGATLRMKAFSDLAIRVSDILPPA